jgi:outer membrane protein assembly factor BamD
MFKLSYLFIIISIILFSSCAKEEIELPTITETSQELEMVSAYREAQNSLEDGDPFFAAKKFLEAELLFPQSEWAPRSALMASYSYYMQNYYGEAISNLERFLKTYPDDKNLAYVNYLIAMCYYETIEDEKRDSAPLLKAKDQFNLVVKNHPNTDFALDAKFKLGLIEDVIASKEMYLGRHYLKKGKWIAAINRFKSVVEDYDQTVFIEEALHRLVEINFKLGLQEESQKYANVLGYNYQSGEWYKKSYKVFNKNYDNILKRTKKKDKKGVIKKFRKLFD